MSKTLAAILGGTLPEHPTLLLLILLFKVSSSSLPLSLTLPVFCSYYLPTVLFDRAVGRAVGIEFSLRDARKFGMEELSAATKDFSDKSLIGQGKFGEVYKGLLHDGILVAIKKRPAPPTHEFIEEVSQEKLEFKHRLQIALGAAKGLAHLHSLSPRLIHKDFKTANVLVDENFIAKVADAGLRNFLGRFDHAGTSSQVAADEVFLAPEASEFRRFSDKSDVYSFGMFLLELVSGQEAKELLPSDVSHNLVEWNLQEGGSISTIIDQRLGNSFTTEGMDEFIQLITQCVNPSSERRPLMSYVVTELDRILEKEMSLTTIMGEGTPVVTLGSQLFMASK
ncbi:hypothetical protein SASPL_106756 [Salvia splendens]|uniref:non-specific serine/threonine protein kinase n=1 Tax=Salvia splendens TaxID=180675 RepID=A0A8X8YLI4_SALSN|nr:hypothetical protein SASPL_106756 [Salvia splendens]